MAAVEFALVAMMMLGWIFGIMEVARAFWTYQIIQEVAIQGARCMGILSADCAVGNAYDAPSTIRYMTAQALKLGLALPAADIVPNRPTVCANTAGFSSVVINYRFVTSLPAVIPALAGLQLTASSCFVNTI